MIHALALAALLAAPSASPAAPRSDGVAPLDIRTFTLPNGLTVILHPDRRLPKVVVNTWVRVGSKDEAPGRTGFAHLFEHLMFMATKRVPGNRFDVLMETAGAANNASTSKDRTNYFSFGPPAALPLLLWLDADRFQALAEAMTQEKVDLQREVVRNERRQRYENQPYGRAELAIPEAMYPEGHSYHHPVIGSHADLEAASLEDVTGFFRTHYVPGNASLVVAGDFDPDIAQPLVASLFGAIPAQPLASSPRPPPVRLDGEVRRVFVDKVELPRLYLVWHAPPAYAPGTAELELLAGILGDGPSSRLERRLVQELRLAESVDVAFFPQTLGSLFLVRVTGVPGADLERLKQETIAAVERVAKAGPAPAELARVKAQREAAFRISREELLARADKLNEYLFFLGEPDAFGRDLARFTGATAAGVRDAAHTLGAGRLDMRVLPGGSAAGAAIPDAPPPPLHAARFDAPAPEIFRLTNGVEVRLVRRPGTGLFAGHLVTDGGERLVPAAQAGLAPVVARLLVSGAGGRSAPEYADAVRLLGARIDTRATHTAIDVSVVGLASRLEPTLDLFVDAFLRPNLAAGDFEREAALARARVAARADEPGAVAQVAAGAALFGPNDPRGRPVDGWVSTVEGLRLADARAMALRLLDPRGAVLVFAGDVDVPRLRRALEARLALWRSRGEVRPPEPAPLAASAAGGRVVLVHRPRAPQTVILAMRPVPGADEVARATREAVNVVLGGSFTSRLNQNLREKHGYTYGARSAFATDGLQTTFLTTASVQTEVTGPALVELRRELDGLAAGLTPEEVSKARETARHRLVEAVETTPGLAGTLAHAVLQRRPADALRQQRAALDGVDVARASEEARGGSYGFSGLTVVLVGDRDAILPQLERAGFPAPAEMDAEGRPLAAKSARR